MLGTQLEVDGKSKSVILALSGQIPPNPHGGENPGFSMQLATTVSSLHGASGEKACISF